MYRGSDAVKLFDCGVKYILCLNMNIFYCWLYLYPITVIKYFCCENIHMKIMRHVYKFKDTEAYLIQLYIWFEICTHYYKCIIIIKG